MSAPAMNAAGLARPPRYSPQLFLALRKVSRGRIGSFDRSGTLRQQTDELSAGIFAALFALRRDGFVRLSDEADAAGWYPAVLTMRGVQLLSAWSLTTGAIQAVPAKVVSRG